MERQFKFLYVQHMPIVSPKHAPSYLASLACRFDRRQLDGIVERLARAAVRYRAIALRVVTADAPTG